VHAPPPPPHTHAHQQNFKIYNVCIYSDNTTSLVCTSPTTEWFLISNFCGVLKIVCFLLGNSPVSEFYMLMFRNTLSVPSSYPPMKMEQTECSETLAYKIQAPGNYPEESIQPTGYFQPIINVIFHSGSILFTATTFKSARQDKTVCFQRLMIIKSLRALL
jgi:hypothetical protein